MAITVQYQPAASVLARTAYQAGAGQFLQREQARQDQMAMAQAELAQRDMAQQRALAANLFSQQMAAQDRAGLMQQQNLFDQQQQKAGFDFQVQRDQAGFDFENRMEGLRTAEAGLAGALADLDRNRDRLAPMDQSKLADLAGRYRAINAARATLRPEQYADLLAKFGMELRDSGITNRIAPPPDPMKEFKGSTIETPYGLFSRDRSGAYRQIADPLPKQFTQEEVDKNTVYLKDGRAIVQVPGQEPLVVPPEKPEKPAKPVTFEDLRAAPDEFRKTFNEEMEAEIAQRKADYEARQAKYKLDKEAYDAKQQYDKDDNPIPRTDSPPPPPPTWTVPTEQEVISRVQRFYPAAPQQPPPATLPATPDPTQSASIPTEPPTAPGSSTDSRSALRIARNYALELARRQGTTPVVIPDPEGMTEFEAEDYLARHPQAQQMALAAGATHGAGPPAAPPPVIEPGEKGEALLLEMLQNSPEGFTFIDARDGKTKFLTAEMVKGRGLSGQSGEGQ